MVLCCPKHPVPLLWHKVVLRILLASLIICFINALVLCIQGTPQRSVTLRLALLTPPLLILLHHTMRLWPKPWWWTIWEILYSMVELGGVFYMNIVMAVFLIPFSNMSSASNVTFMLAASWLTNLICSFTALVFLLWNTLHFRGKTIGQPYQFVAPTSPHNKLGHQWQLFFGGFTLRKRFSSDNNTITYVRGGFAVLCLVSLSYLAFFSLLGQPLQQGRQIAIKTLKLPVGEIFPFQSNQLYYVWHLEINHMVDLHHESLITSALNISGVFSAQDDRGTLRSGSYQCSKSEANFADISVSCLPNAKLEHASLLDIGQEVLFTFDLSTIPDTAIWGPLEVGVYRTAVGTSGNTRSVWDDMRPVYLGRGSHLAGYFWSSFRDQISNKAVTALGIQQYHRVEVPHIDSLSPDWSIGQGNNTATLRLRMGSQYEVLVEQEYYENSVISGFALLGGVWTVVNGLFAAVFGSTLLLVLFGIKPLSIYGLVHSFRAGRCSLVGQGYALPPEERDKIIATLREHLLNVDEEENMEPHYVGAPQCDRECSIAQVHDMEGKWANLV